jgi:hypothetical protein
MSPRFQFKILSSRIKIKEVSMQTKPGIVFCHGLWADGSCFSKLIVPLQAEGYECIAAQYGLNTTAEDVALVKATIGRVTGLSFLSATPTAEA